MCMCVCTYLDGSVLCVCVCVCVCTYLDGSVCVCARTDERSIPATALASSAPKKSILQSASLMQWDNPRFLIEVLIIAIWTPILANPSHCTSKDEHANVSSTSRFPVLSHSKKIYLIFQTYSFPPFYLITQGITEMINSGRFSISSATVSPHVRPRDAAQLATLFCFNEL